MGDQVIKTKSRMHWSAQAPVMEKFREFSQRMGTTIHPYEVLGANATKQIIEAYDAHRLAKDRFMTLMAERAIRTAELEGKPKERGAS